MSTETNRPQPTLIYAYGGFNAPWVPQFPGPMAAFVAMGGVFVHAHLRGGPGRQIGVFGVRETLDIAWTYSAWPLPAWIGCGFRRLIVEIALRESDAATPVRIRFDGRHCSLDRPIVEAGAHQPAEIR